MAQSWRPCLSPSPDVDYHGRTMTIPQVAIVGRPNVGKSSIFNWLAGRRIAIVDDVAGVTRDRLTQLIEHEDRYFELVDTGGIGIADSDNLTVQIEEQISTAIDLAHVILFVVDTRSGIAPLDEHVAQRLRSVNKPIICLANKTDDVKLEPQADEFHRLAPGTLLKVSTHQHKNQDLLLEMILENLPPATDEPEQVEPEMKIALVGRRNVGKSTFINSLIQSDRMIVSEVPGTTRDSVDVRFELDGKSFLAIDTPGSAQDTRACGPIIEFYGMHRAQRSIRRADVVLMFFDASQRISKVDKQLCHYINEQYKPCIFVVNKWDLLAEQYANGTMGRLLARQLPDHAVCPDRLHHGPDRQEFEDAAESCPDALQAVAVSSRHGGAESAGKKGSRASFTTPAQTSPTEDLLRNPSRRTASYNHSDVQYATGISARLPSLYAECAAR